MSTLIIQADARSLPLAAASVDLVVTSPPYFGLRSYTDGGEHYDGQIGSEPTPAEWLQAMLECTREMMRVLKPTGSIWVNLGDKYVGPRRGPNGTSSALTNGAQYRIARNEAGGYEPDYGNAPRKSLLGTPWRYAIRCMDELGLTLRAEVVWSKPNGLPESVTDRVRRSHETWFHFVTQPRYYAAIDEIRVPYAAKTFTVGTTPRRSDDGSAGDKRNKWHAEKGTTRADMLHRGGALPGSVWEVATQPLAVPEHLGVNHFAAFPIEWPRRIIRGWCPPGGRVLDPFGGTGTTALAATALGRVGISVDRSADYCRIAHWRTADPRELAKAMGVEKPAAQLAGQTDLLEHLEAA